MKTAKLILSGCIALAMAQAAHAQTVVRITGSTAYRSNVETAITNVLDAGFTYGYVGTSGLGKAGSAIFTGAIGGSPVIIKTTFTGSEGGIQTVASNGTGINVAFLPDTTAQSPGGTSGAADPTVSPNPVDSSIPDVALSDTFQATSQFNGFYKGINYVSLTEATGGSVGVVPFKFAASKAAPAGLTNVTSQLARTLFSAGKMSLSLWTGVNADETTSVYATGRDPDSGTRLTAFAETGVGATATVKQYAPRDSTNTIITTSGGAVNNFAAWPASTVNGIAVSLFNGGYNSGGKLANALGNTTPANTVMVSYLGTNDFDGTALPAGAVELSYNGVKLGVSANYNLNTLLTEGAYTFWGYEHLYYRSGSPAATIADSIAARLRTVDAAVLISSMRASRSTDGAKVTQFGY